MNYSFDSGQISETACAQHLSFYVVDKGMTNCKGQLHTFKTVL